MMKKLYAVAMAALLFAVSCSKDEENPTPSAPQTRIMFAHTTISVDTIRILVNDTPLVGTAVIPYAGNTGYVAMNPGSKKIAFTLANNLPLTDTTVNLSADQAYSMFSTGTVINVQKMIIQDDLSAPKAGHAKVRFVNMSVDTFSYNAFVGAGDTAELGTNIMHKGFTGFSEFVAGSYNLQMERVKDSGPADIVQIPNYQLASGKIYTILLSGSMTVQGAGERSAKVILHN